MARARRPGHIPLRCRIYTFAWPSCERAPEPRSSIGQEGDRAAQERTYVQYLRRGIVAVMRPSSRLNATKTSVLTKGFRSGEIRHERSAIAARRHRARDPARVAA